MPYMPFSPIRLRNSGWISCAISIDMISATIGLKIVPSQVESPKLLAVVVSERSYRKYRIKGTLSGELR